MPLHFDGPGRPRRRRPASSHARAGPLLEPLESVLQSSSYLSKRMRGHKARSIILWINIPSTADIQCCAIRSHQWTIHYATDTVARAFGLHHFVFTRMLCQRPRELFPILGGESESQKEPRLRSADRVIWIKEIRGNFPFRYNCTLDTRNFQSGIPSRFGIQQRPSFLKRSASSLYVYRSIPTLEGQDRILARVGKKAAEWIQRLRQLNSSVKRGLLFARGFGLFSRLR
jgi:hypothetical protein